MRNTKYFALAGALIAGVMMWGFALSSARRGGGPPLTGNAMALTPAVRLAVSGVSHSSTTQTQSGGSIDFTMVALEVFQPAQGSPLQRAERTFYSRSDGTFATVDVSYDKDGTVSNRETIVGELGRGLFRVNEAEKRLILIAPLPQDANSPFTTDVRSNRDYHGDDSILGYRTVILRKPRKDSYTDLYYSPELKSIIKTVTVSQAGTTTVEPRLISLGPINSALFASLAAFSIDTSVYRKRLEKVEQIQGETGSANELRKQIQDATRPRIRF